MARVTAGYDDLWRVVYHCGGTNTSAGCYVGPWHVPQCQVMT